MRLRRAPDEIQFRSVSWPINQVDGVVSCGMCSALIPDDEEGANRGEHEAWHREVLEALHALRDGKADA